MLYLKFGERFESVMHLCVQLSQKLMLGSNPERDNHILRAYLAVSGWGVYTEKYLEFITHEVFYILTLV